MKSKLFTKNRMFFICGTYMYILFTLIGCSPGIYPTQQQPITLSSLIDEMVSIKSDPCFPVPFYTSKQLTSYDRRSVIPNTPSWHANDDFSGFIRYEANNGRVEKVLFDEQGPGVITRIITTGGDKNASLRFYFDGEKEASIMIPNYDIAKMPMDIPPGMIYKHEHYPTTQGCSFYYPIPYQKSCKITVDNPDRVYVYHVNYRSYAPSTKITTFNLKDVVAIKEKADKASNLLLHPETYNDNQVSANGKLTPHNSLNLVLPEGSKAIRTLRVNISEYNETDYGQLMRGLILKINFDGVETVHVPISDFSGAGMGAPKVDSWYLSADGAGDIVVRFVMPYRKNAKIEIENITNFTAEATIQAYISDWTWYANTLYFHATWRQENGLQTNSGNEYNMGTLTGRGVFKGDVLSLYNHMTRWYGEGDEHIWVDDDDFPSHFGCGTEDYYNTTYAPIHVYHNPFGGAPREDNEDSRGFNTFVRTRNLDVIPFNKKLKFDFELVSWDTGKVDYSSTIYWYGDLDSKAVNASPKSDALYLLPVAIN